VLAIFLRRGLLLQLFIVGVVGVAFVTINCLLTHVVVVVVHMLAATVTVGVIRAENIVIEARENAAP